MTGAAGHGQAPSPSAHEIVEARRGEYLISTDPARLDLESVARFLAGAYWSTGIPQELVERAIQRSISFGVYRGDRQVGFARVITDAATFAYVADVYVLPNERGHGLGVWLMETVVAHPALQGLRRIVLATRDAHGLYAKVGFAPLAAPERWMEIHDPDIYARADSGDEREDQ
jgi:N-acetylglutamate synthase-like GNAT family acetyltransferase